MEVLIPLVRLIAAIAGFASACAAAAVPGALFEHGEILAGAPGEPIQVRTGLLQLEIAPGIVASAQGGTIFQVQSRPAEKGALEFTVFEGSLRIVQPETDRLVVVGPGRYALSMSDRLMVRATSTPETPADASRQFEIDYRQGVNLADAILLRQNEKLAVDTRTLIQSIFRIFGR